MVVLVKVVPPNVTDATGDTEPVPTTPPDTLMALYGITEYE